MFTFALIGWALAIGLGFGWWRERRGLAGIRRDLADANRVLNDMIARGKNAVNRD